MNRGWGLGLALGALALLAAGCSDAPMAAVGLAAEQTAGRVAPSAPQRRATVDRRELRPFAIRVSGRYYVRMGAFDDREAARALASELRRVTTEPVEVAEYGTGAGRNAVRLYRVLIGPATSRDSVVELVDALNGMGYGAPRATRSVAVATEPETPAEVASAQAAAGSDLVEPVGDETEATQAVTQRPQAPPPEREAPRPTAGEMPPPGDPEATAEDVAATHDTDIARSPGDVIQDPQRAPQVGTYAPERRVKAFMVPEDGRRFLQMAAYAARSTAEILASQLRLVTSEPVLVSETVGHDGRSLYRVRIGPVGSDDALATLVDALRPSYGTGWVLPATPSTSATRSTPSTSEIASTRSTLSRPSPAATSPAKARATRTAWVIYGDSEHFVQVGAYAARSWANAVASELSRQIGGAVRVTEVMRDGGDPVYRVRVGPIRTDDSLTALVDALESLGYVVD